MGLLTIASEDDPLPILLASDAGPDVPVVASPALPPSGRRPATQPDRIGDLVQLARRRVVEDPDYRADLLFLDLEACQRRELRILMNSRKGREWSASVGFDQFVREP